MIHGERRFVRVATVVLVLASGVFIAPAAAQSVNVTDIQTTLTDENGDGLDDRVRIDVTVENSRVATTVTLGESNFDVDTSPTPGSSDQPAAVRQSDPDGDGDNETVNFALPSGNSFTVVAELSNQKGGEIGTVDVTVDGGAANGSATYTVSGQGGGGTADDGGGEGRGDGNTGASEGDGDKGADGQNNGSASDGGGEAADETGTGGGSDGADGGSGSEGLPGFTTVVALLALVVSAVYYRNRNR